MRASLDKASSEAHEVVFESKMDENGDPLPTTTTPTSKFDSIRNMMRQSLGYDNKAGDEDEDEEFDFFTQTGAYEEGPTLEDFAAKLKASIHDKLVKAHV